MTKRATSGRPAAACRAVPLILLLFGAALPLRAAQPTASPLRVTFQARSVAVDGVSKGGQVVLFAMWRKSAPIYSIQGERAVALDSDGNGHAEFLLCEAPAPASVWTFVDLATGDYVTACPSAQCNGLARTMPKQLLKKDPGGEVATMLVPFEMARLYVVRPKDGAWGGSVGDGGGADEDGALDGKVTVSPQNLRPITRRDAPRKLRKDDLVILYDGQTLRFAIAQITN